MEADVMSMPSSLAMASMRFRICGFVGRAKGAV